MRQKTLKMKITPSGFSFDEMTRPLKVGEHVMLMERYYENTNKSIYYVSQSPDYEDGVPGNFNREIKRFHGWRGSYNNVGTYAHGRREVIKADEPKHDPHSGDLIQKITVGRDLTANKD